MKLLGEGYEGCLRAHSARNKKECETNKCVWNTPAEDCNNSWTLHILQNRQYGQAQKNIRDLDHNITILSQQITDEWNKIVKLMADTERSMVELKGTYERKLESKLGSKLDHTISMNTIIKELAVISHHFKY